MRARRPIATLLLHSIVLAALALFALGPATLAYAEQVAHLRNGFSIPHHSREARGSIVRLYLDDTKASFVDIPAAEIAGFSIQPDPEPSQGEVQNPAASPGKSTDQIVRDAGAKQGVDSDFIASVIRQESDGNPHAVSRAGAQGLMQLMPETAHELGVQDSFNPEQNVHGGARYLRELLERYHGDAIKALAAYNAGPGAVDRYGGVPPYRETRLYVQRVVQNYNRKKERAEAHRRPSASSKAAGANGPHARRQARKPGHNAHPVTGIRRDQADGAVADRAALVAR